MNTTQQSILYTLKTLDRSVSLHSSHFTMNITTLSIELEKLERQGLVDLERIDGEGIVRKRIRRAIITEKGKMALEEALMEQSDASMIDQVKQLKEIVETLQQAIDEMNKSKSKPKDKDIIDKLNKYLTVANGVPNLIKNVIELYSKVHH